MLAIYVGATILFTYFRYAEWFDAVNRLGISGIPFFFDYEEGLIRGGVLGLIIAVCIYVIFNKFIDARKCKPVTGALWVFASYSVATAICILTQPYARDPGLVIELMIPGFSAVASTWLYGGNVLLDREPQILDKDVMLEWIHLEHKETIGAITPLCLVVISSIVVGGYNYLHGSLRGDTIQPNLAFAWYTFSLRIFDYGLVAVGFAIFTMAPLFMRLDILKAKLKKMQTNASISPRRRLTR